MTPLGGIQVQVSRTRQRSFLPRGIKALERRSPEVAELIRQAFWRGISTRAVGLPTDEPVSAKPSMRKGLEAVRRRDHDPVKAAIQKIYWAPSRAEARNAFARFKWNGQSVDPGPVQRLEGDLPELLNFFQFPKPLCRKLRTTNALERCFVQVRRRTRPRVVFTNLASLHRIIYAIFSRFNNQWKNHTLKLLTQAA